MLNFQKQINFRRSERKRRNDFVNAGQFSIISFTNTNFNYLLKKTKFQLYLENWNFVI